MDTFRSHPLGMLLTLAISDLIRWYEMASGQVVVRMEIGKQNRKVTLDAIPSIRRDLPVYRKM